MSGIIRGVTTQSGADTFTQTLIETNLTASSKAAWQINKVRAFWTNGYTAAAADQMMSAVLATRITTVTTMNESEELARVSWAVANTAGVAVAYPFEPIKELVVPMDRITAQPFLYMGCSSLTTGLSNVIYWEITYEIVKLTDIEVLRLLVGGA